MLFLFFLLSIILCVLACKRAMGGLDVFGLSTPVRTALATIPLPPTLAPTLAFGLFGFMGAVAATVSLFVRQG